MAIRLDKYLADMGMGTRSEVKKIISKGRVRVDGQVFKEPSYKINPETANLSVDGIKITYSQFEYIMLNKPAGVVSATTDNVHKTVIDILGDVKKKDLFPVGRLDIDTEGLLIITNDGMLAHNLLSPKKHVQKTYYAKTDKILTEEGLIRLKTGVKLEENFVAKADDIKALSEYEYNITIHEGKFHQVKRMFEAVGLKVVYLKRISMGKLELDENLLPGYYRKLTENELEIVWNNTKV